MPIFVSLRPANSSINSNKQTNKQTKNPSILIYKILTFTIIIYRIVLLMAEGASTASSFLEMDPLKIDYPEAKL